MLHKKAIVLSILGVLVVSGVAFGVSRSSMSDLMSSTVNGRPGHNRPFVCSESAVAVDSRETREYERNLAEKNQLTQRQTSLQSDPYVASNTCHELKKQKQRVCQKNVAELRSTIKKIAQISPKIGEYEVCKAQYNITSTLKILTPAEKGEHMYIGEKTRITWEAKGSFYGGVFISLLSADTGAYIGAIDSTEPGAISFDWDGKTICQWSNGPGKGGDCSDVPPGDYKFQIGAFTGRGNEYVTDVSQFPYSIKLAQ